MTEIWQIAVIALWVIVTLEGLLFVVLARQIGLLHMRLTPVGARTMDAGPQIGLIAPSIRVKDIYEQLIEIVPGRKKRTLITFIAPGCAVCEDILPGLKTIAQSERDITEVIVITGNTTLTQAQGYVREHGLSHIPFVVSDQVVADYRISTTPYAVLLDKDNNVKAKGLVNDLAQLESILNAGDLGHHSIQSYLGIPEKLQVQEARKINGSNNGSIIVNEVQYEGSSESRNRL